MDDLEKLRQAGWSYNVGYNHDYRSYVARAWKPRPKPELVPCQGGADVLLFLWCASGLGTSLEDAAAKCAAKAIEHAGDGAWWNGLPIDPASVRR